MLSRMEMDIDKALKQYDSVGTAVFARPRPFSWVRGANAIRPKYKSRYMEHAIQKIIQDCLQSEMKLHNARPKSVAYASNSARCRTLVMLRVDEQQKHSNTKPG